MPVAKDATKLACIFMHSTMYMKPSFSMQINMEEACEQKHLERSLLFKN